ncbi:hypothetical protein PRIPAC_94083 [Pristionchus pacificus]|uniref:Cytochrome P450 n=1 Tax=Pristionchus pacificus TaxID=54126 RepID=A0A2A6BB87_PRIPA|nr:hypothetical protein PRIPAC_94083 [Pristionchus pacificus]|eukprot:PDM63136.1 cytochrome P450 [Pristionchus pacificus]
MVSAPHYSLLASSADNVSESPTIRAKQKEESPSDSANSSRHSSFSSSNGRDSSEEPISQQNILARLFQLPEWIVAAGLALLYLIFLRRDNTIWDAQSFLLHLIGLPIFLLCSLSIWRWLRFELRSFIDPLALPPGPMTLPILGSLATINASEPQKSVLKWKAKFGPIFTIALPVPTVVICGYDELRSASTKSETAARPTSYLYTMFLHNKEEGNGMILSSGSTWKKAKSFANSHFNTYGVNDDRIIRRVEEYSEVMVELIEKEMEMKGSVLNLHRILSYTVASIIVQIVLGRSYKIGDEKMEYLKNLLDQVLANEFFRKELELNRVKLESNNNNEETDEDKIDLDNIMAKHINRPTELVNGDMDSIVLAGDIWTGGMETTLTATRWAIIFFMANPEIQETLHREIVARYPRRSNGKFDWTSRREELPYLCATLDEILRLANVLPWNIPHRALRTFTLNDKVIKEGTNLMFSFSSIHHDEELFPDPYKFNPERFLRRVPTREETVQWTIQGRDVNDFVKYEKSEHVCPFGMGLRRCPGEQLAMKELFVFVIVLVQRFRFGQDVSHPPNTTRPMGMTSVPKDYVCRIEKRSDWYD